MTLRIYNTLTRAKDTFEPITPGKVHMYVCGPTVYDSCHIGHARSVVVFDVILRYLRLAGYEVVYVRNFTDVDDKIIRRANELGVDAKTIAEKYIREFHEDMDTLNVERASHEPKATEHIQEIVGVIEKLIERQKAYEVDGDVYFAVSTFDNYGKLSGRRLDEMEAGARIEVDARKRNPFDFALWKAAKPGEPSWESPWGKGRPGWHIECSAMSARYLGETFDIHGGGKDLIFPHHENEIAQSEAVFGKPLAKYWIHNGFVNINQEKMSKSLGNFLMIREAFKSHHPEAIRLFLLSHHYRSPIDFNTQSMEEAKTNLDKMYALLERLESTCGVVSEGKTDTHGPFWSKFIEAMDDDFNTARAIGVIFEMIRHCNRLLDESGDDVSQQTTSEALALGSEILRMGRILGILSNDPNAYFEAQQASALQNLSVDVEKIEQLIQMRYEARKVKDWAKADQIRQELEAMNIILVDKPEGTEWKLKS